MSSDGFGVDINTGDRVAAVVGDQIIVGTAEVESGGVVTFVPDGEPQSPASDWIAALTNWMDSSEGGSYSVSDESAPEPAIEPIPYDEMRRLCGLPDVRGYVASREFARMGKQLGEVFQYVAEAWTEAVNKALPGLQAFAESSKPKQDPPMWAVDPAHSRRTRNRVSDIRTPYR